MVLGFTLYFAAPTYAVPMLGVASDGLYCNPGGGSLEDYQAHFASGITSDCLTEGFLIDPSGDNLFIFTNILDTSDIYLLADATLTSTVIGDITFTADSFSEPFDDITIDGMKIASYPPETTDPSVYLGLLLPATTDLLWETITDSAFPGTYKVLEGDITLDLDGGTLGLGGYFFAVADTVKPGGASHDLQGAGFGGPKDKFSPKTTSATPIPEPGTLLLIGTGLVCLGAGAWQRKRL